MHDPVRFESLMATLDDLVDASPEAIILVEGQRDVEVLRALGCAGELVQVHQGRNLLDVCEAIASRKRPVIILTDWDRKGGELKARVRDHLVHMGARVDVTFRDRIWQWANGTLKDVESLLPYVRRGLERYHATTLEERRRMLDVAGDA